MGGVVGGWGGGRRYSAIPFINYFSYKMLACERVKCSIYVCFTLNVCGQVKKIFFGKKLKLVWLKP